MKPASPVDTRSVTEAYEALVADGALAGDPAQRKAAALLDGIAQRLVALEAERSGIAGFFKRRKPVPCGAYIWGGVGRGKSMLMDLFFETVDIPGKRRVHFHQFMDEVHTAIARYRSETRAGNDARDPIPAAVRPILEATRLLCFDEFHVTDIANAMLLQRLFEQLFAAGVVVVATSNVAPDALYENGLNRQLFLPFIDLLKSRVTVHELAAVRDYRRDKLTGPELFHFGENGAAAMDRVWGRLTGGRTGGPATLDSLGRKIAVPRQADGVARFSFGELCGAPLGARDYLRISKAYHTLIIDDVPRMERTRSNAAKRFIQLIDTLYDHGNRVAASFAVPLDYLGGDEETAFEFQRCMSRLTEMQSEDYLASPRMASSTAS